MMIEADALCSRIAIVAKGSLKVVGTQQHLKDNYGSGYLLQVRVQIFLFFWLISYPCRSRSFLSKLLLYCMLYIHSSTWLMIMTRQSTPFYNLSKQISTKMLGLLQSRQRRSTSICLGMLAFKISLQPYIQTKQLKVSQR